MTSNVQKVSPFTGELILPGTVVPTRDCSCHLPLNHDHAIRVDLEEELDGFWVDAYALSRCRANQLGSIRTDRAVNIFLGQYRLWISPEPSRICAYPSVRSIDSESLRWIEAYHRSVAEPLAREYKNWAYANLTKAAASFAAKNGAAAPSSSRAVIEIDLRRSEEIRIFRAIYRYEIYYRLFGQSDVPQQHPIPFHQVNAGFCCIFNPWEVEEIGCIDLFVREKYEDLFNQVEADLSPEMPTFLRNPEGSVNMITDRDTNKDDSVSCGLGILAQLLATESHQLLVDRIEQCFAHYDFTDPSLEEVISTQAQYDRRGQMPNSLDAKDAFEACRDPMEFLFDPIVPDVPPLAWVLLWDGIYSNIYGEYVPEPLRRWGYVMWDEDMWDDLGVKDMIAFQWHLAPNMVDKIYEDYGWAPVPDYPLI
ncbi:hypothetical protein B0T10DRAFT_574936 [Thelonectria olida]|uniref:Uncharacterized protein n=1 Tax=Thelonectria olida TaxID=1576542 RepID=A0A9P8W1P8_9HYPO|nr:hypothetical protein B0T10DRAFT_574936 [Thelonectria olida]